MKLPPQDIATEESIIAGCLLFPDMLIDIVDILSPEHFYRAAHQKIMTAIFSQYKKNEPYDLASIGTALKAEKKLQEVGGAAYLAKIIDIPIPANMEYSANILKEKEALRKTITICQQTINTCFENIPSSEIIDNTQKSILSIDSGGKDNFMSMGEIIEASIERYENDLKEKTSKKIKTGFHEFDTVAGGIKGSKLVIIAARPRIGKTAICVNMAENMARAGRKVGIFEIEMDKEDLADRIIAGASGVSTIKLQTPKYLTAHDWQSITDAAAERYELPILVDDTGGLKIVELKRRIRKMKKAGCEIVFIDQLSKIIGDRRKKKFEEVTGIVEELGHLKKELRMPIVLLAQINRGATARLEGRPTLEDLKSSGQIEEEADIVILLNRPYVYTKKEEDRALAFFDIAKNRGGPERVIQLHWTESTTTFSNMLQGDR